MKNSNYTIGNRTRDLLACSAVPQPTVLPRAPINFVTERKLYLAAGSVPPRAPREMENYSCSPESSNIVNLQRPLLMN